VSIRIDPDPRPRANPAPTRGIRWPVRRIIVCPPIAPPPNDESFGAVLELRRSGRAIVTASLREVVNALAFATRPRFLPDGDDFDRSRRPTVSSGALHPVECIVVDWRGAMRIMRYAPREHHLELLIQHESNAALTFAQTCREILPTAARTAIVLVGDGARLAAAYDNSASLLWRDAGALLQTLSLVATAYRMAFCPLGLLGREVVNALGIGDHAVPLGVGLLGRPLPTSSVR
jgi:hypothetical protein